MVLVAVDTNVLAYAEGVNGDTNKRAARRLLDALPKESTLLPAQTLGELFNVLVRKAAYSPRDARAAVLSWGDAFPVIDTSSDVLVSAFNLSAKHQLNFWDAIIVSAAADAGCRLLLSEDLQDGFTWGSVTVTNPFSSSGHALLDAL